jgi:hypothetical protein
MQAWQTPHRALGSPLHRNRKPSKIMCSAGNVSKSQTKLKNFTLQDASSSPPTQDGRIILYTHCLCPYAERAWLALLEKVTFYFTATHRPSLFSRRFLLIECYVLTLTTF